MSSVDLSSVDADVRYLRSPEAVRERSESIFEAGLYGELEHFSIHLEELPAVAHLVVEATRDAYPDLRIPLHGRFRHFGAAGIDRLGGLDEAMAEWSEEERARARIDLVVTSVLLDAGAGAAWRFREEDTGLTFARSEGLAVASFHAFRAGLFSGRAEAPLEATAEGLTALDERALGHAFQVSGDNPIVGLSGRAELLRSLGAAIEENEMLFGSPPRVGNLFDHLAGRARRGCVSARAVLESVLEGLAPIWPERIRLGEANLGDVWRHPRAGGEGPTAGLVPFHKLSQWLAYSLVEPLELAGLRVEELDALTGLAEYRNGGLFVDGGVLRPKAESALSETHLPGSELVVEWRALTVALLDRTAEAVRDELRLDRKELPLTRVLEGGTWRAGRALAEERRPGGPPPIRVESDGTVF